MIYFKQIRRFAYLFVLIVFALIEMSRSGLARRTFEFFAYDDNRSVVEERMLHKSAGLEADIKSYIEELILGPVSLDIAPLLTQGAGVRSFMYRDNIVYVDFTREAALPVQGSRPLFDSFLTLNQGIRRNFHAVDDVKLFVYGNEVFFEEFMEYFGSD